MSDIRDIESRMARITAEITKNNETIAAGEMAAARNRHMCWELAELAREYLEHTSENVRPLRRAQ